MLENYQFNSDLFRTARRLVRDAAERAKPNGERLPEHRDSGRRTFELALFSPKPVHPDFEEVKLAHALTFLAVELGANDPVVQAALAGQSPATRAAELVHGTRVGDVAYRRELHALDAAALAAVPDPMVRFALAVDEAARAARRAVEQQNEVKAQAHARIARVRYAKDGAAVAPDATFTLRLSIGTVRGVDAPGGRPPYDLPESWVAARPRLDLGTPYNFISTNYSIGGNSGSPTIDREGRFIGIIFDGNIHTLVWNYAYTDAQARSVSVDVRAILEAMRKVYGADALVAELLAGG